MSRRIVRLSLFVLCLALSALAIGGRAEADPCEEGARFYGMYAGCCLKANGFNYEVREVYVCQDGLWSYEGTECTWALCWS